VEEKMKERVLKYMQDFGAITTFEAFTDLGTTRLSAYIYLLRADYQIDDEWISAKNRYDENIKYKKYILVKKY
jgi:hypothetical protein